MDELVNLMQRKEDLHPELRQHLCTIPGVGACIKHPLLFSVPYFKELNALHNVQLEQRKKYLLKAIEKREWSEILGIHERPYRLHAFVTYVLDWVSDEDYWEALSWLWTDSENIWQHMTDWTYYLQSKRPHRGLFMDEDERKAFAAMPDILTVYRGYVPGQNKRGLSYTLDAKVAQWFSTRFSKRGKVHIRRVPKHKVFAYLAGRKEQEVILL